MNTIDKNSRSGFGKALGAWFGCAVLFAGLALPAYGQSITSPSTCGAGPSATGTGPTRADTDASSFAAGCGADASTDGSVAIGDNAKVNEHTTKTPGGVRGLLTTTTTNPQEGNDVKHTGLDVVRRDEDNMYYREEAPGSGFTVPVELPMSVENTSYARTITFTEMGQPPGTAPAGVDSIAIGSGSSVTGDNSIAIGAGSIVGMAARTNPNVDAVANNNSVAIGAGAKVTDHNGIAIGGGTGDLNNDGDTDDEGETAVVTAGENQIVIGRAGQSAVIGGVNLAAGIATNTAGIATNTADIATEATARTNADAALGVRIDTNKDAIDTNRSGIAAAVALAGLPTFKGGAGGWGIALGTFDSETAVAVGANFNLGENGNKTVKLGVSSSGGETSGSIGFGMGF